MKDLMIDIETLGQRAGCAILSIGARQFAAETGELGEMMFAAISLESCKRAGFGADLDTVAWWMKQSDEARIEAFGGEVDIVEALKGLASLVESCAPDRVWAKPPSFDIVILEAAYEALGMPIPWHYRTHRCVRTIMDAAGVKPRPAPPSHRALDDADVQVEAVALAMRTLLGRAAEKPDTVLD